MNILKMSFLFVGMSLGTSSIQADDFIPCPAPEEIHWKQRNQKIHPHFYQPFSPTFEDGVEVYSKEEPSTSDLTLIEKEAKPFEKSEMLTCIYKIKGSEYKAIIHHFVPNPLNKWIHCSLKTKNGQDGFSCKEKESSM